MAERLRKPKANERIEVEVTYTFKGKVFVEGAKDTAEAEELVRRDFGCTVGSLHSSNIHHVVDWDFGVHPEEVEIKAV